MTDKRRLAELQTDWAAERTVLAIEATFASWLRTGMAALGVALGLHAVFVSDTAGLYARVTATLFVVIAILLFWAGERNARGLLKEVGDQRRLPRQADFTRLTVLFVVGSLAVGAMLWII